MTRRSLDQLGGKVRFGGDEALARELAQGWDRAASLDPDVLTHGFHSWPARLHWALARTVLRAFPAPVVLDPFCGGGTVLVEARAADRQAIGIDLNPLAMRVARVRTERRDAESRQQFLDYANQVAEQSEARVRARVPIRVELPAHELAWYAPHVIKELGGLREEIRNVEDDQDRRALAVVFSSILIKVSRQRSDTAAEVAERRIRKGLTTELFLRKAEELVARWSAYAPVATGPRPKLYEGDARRIADILGGEQVDLVLTSPPYGGTYDYAQHHARRIAWLGLDDRALKRFELGSRRQVGEGGRARWDSDVSAMLHAMAEVLRPGGRVAMVVGDARLGDEHIHVPDQLQRLAPGAGLRLEAIASQQRREWRETSAAPASSHAKGPLEEHFVVLAKDGAPRPRER